MWGLTSWFFFLKCHIWPWACTCYIFSKRWKYYIFWNYTQFRLAWISSATLSRGFLHDDIPPGGYFSNNQHFNSCMKDKMSMHISVGSKLYFFIKICMSFLKHYICPLLGCICMILPLELVVFYEEALSMLQFQYDFY